MEPVFAQASDAKASIEKYLTGDRWLVAGVEIALGKSRLSANGADPAESRALHYPQQQAAILRYSL